jgi:hypothetical protein
VVKRRMSTKRGRRPNGARRAWITSKGKRAWRRKGRRRANPAAGGVNVWLAVALIAAGVYYFATRPSEMKAIEF